MKNIKKLNNLLIIIIYIWDLYYVYQAIATSNGRLATCLVLFPILIFPKIARLLGTSINPVTELGYIIFVFLAQFLGSVVNLYSTIEWFDIFTHGLSGVVSGFLAFILLVKCNHYEKSDTFFHILFIMAIVFFIAGVWETFEFAMDQLTGSNLQHALETGVEDTMFDTVAAVIGGIIFTIFYLIEHIKKNGIIHTFIKNID